MTDRPKHFLSLGLLALVAAANLGWTDSSTMAITALVGLCVAALASHGAGTAVYARPPGEPPLTRRRNPNAPR
jgi:hypothetical protein